MNKGIFGLPPGPVFLQRENNEVEIVSSSAETLFATFPVPVTFQSDFSVLDIIMWGDFLHNNVSTDAFTVSIEGGKGKTDLAQTTLYTSAATDFAAAVAATRGPWYYRGQYTFFWSSTGTLSMIGDVNSLTFRRQDTGLTLSFTIAVGVASGPLPVAIPNGLERINFTGAWGVSHANNSWKKSGSLYRIQRSPVVQGLL